MRFSKPIKFLSSFFFPRILAYLAHKKTQTLMSQKTQMQPKTTLLPFSVDRSFRLDDMFNTKCSMFNNRPFGDKPSRDLLFIKLWAIA